MVFFLIRPYAPVLESSGTDAPPPGPRYGIKALSCVHLSSVINRYEIMRPQFVVLAAGSPLLEPRLPPSRARGQHVLEEPGISMDSRLSPRDGLGCEVKILVSLGWWRSECVRRGVGHVPQCP
ncbi:hypothetical protein E2C01_082731 [Portunus trituberculatus]|uniref:Uncharacterized protein n=1 Tax=Portunus trituberculatus TaxID=210409 RepID=A0A5B7IVC0_PORTR|nr:hypothetical protein [Portunus trituberculatus]